MRRADAQIQLMTDPKSVIDRNGQAYNETFRNVIYKKYILKLKPNYI